MPVCAANEGIACAPWGIAVIATNPANAPAAPVQLNLFRFIAHSC
jgi:hypothetical protein